MLIGVTVVITSSLLAGESKVTPRPHEARPLLVGNWADPTVLKDGDSIILQPGMDVSSMTTFGWHALRPALFATGTAKARFACLTPFR